MLEWVQWLNENWHLIVVPIVVFVAFIIGGRWLRRIAYDRYNRWASRTKQTGLSLFLAKLYGPFFFWFVLLGAYVAIRLSVLPVEISGIIYTLLLSLFVGSWIWVAISLSGIITRLYLPKVRQYLAKVRAPQPPTGLVINGLRAIFIIAGTAILISIWKLPDITGFLALITAFTIGILALREATTGISNRLHLGYRTQKRLRSAAKVFLSLLGVAGIADTVRRVYLIASKGSGTTLDLVILFLEIGFVIWFINILRSPNYRQAKPSFKLVSALFISTALILAFAGVQPLANYKNVTVQYLETQATKINELVEAQSSQGNITEIVGRVGPAIVRLEAGDYLGTGMIIDRTGYVLTCNHIVEDTQLVSAILHGGGRYTATVISRDQQKDLAIVKVNATGIDFPTVTLGNSSELEIGQEILVIGYSLGLEGETTISKGIISAFRSDEDVDYIQTDAAVNPGCSGGPLLNLKGDTVGVVTFKLAGEAVEGMGFAVSIDSAKQFIGGTLVDQKAMPSEEPSDKIEKMEREVLALVNSERQSRNIPTLAWDDELYRLATTHSEEMVKQGRLFHSSMSEPYAENCWGGAAYYHDAGDIFSTWMDSDKHRTWLLCPHLKHVGVGIAVSGGEMYASWTFWRSETTYDDWWYDDGGSPPPWWY